MSTRRTVNSTPKGLTNRRHRGSSASVREAPSPLRPIICTREHAPEWMTDNPFVYYGFRVHFQVFDCVLSLFRLHNETWNCWSHLLGMFLFLLTSWYTLASPSFLFNLLAHEPVSYEFMDQLVFLAAMVGFVICFTASTCFHCFGCCSESSANRLLQLDYMGISVGIASCYLPAMRYAFYCIPHLQYLYITIVVVYAVITLTLYCFPAFHGPRFAVGRILLFVGLVVFGFIPMTQWIRLRGLHSVEVQTFMWRVLLQYLLLLTGFLFYVSKFPERLLPRSRLTSLWIHSHLLWHLFVLLGMAGFLVVGLQYFAFVQHELLVNASYCVTVIS